MEKGDDEAPRLQMVCDDDVVNGRVWRGESPTTYHRQELGLSQ